MIDVKKNLAQNLLFYRKKFGYTQKQIAEKLHVRNSAVSNWENGQNSIDIETLYTLCELYGVTLDEMYGVNTERQPVLPLSEDEERLILAYRNNPAMQSAVNKLLGIE